MHIGTRIKQVREEKGMTQKELAEMFKHHCNASTLSKWENNGYPDTAFLVDLGKRFKLTGDWLLFEKGKPYRKGNTEGKSAEELFGEIKEILEERGIDDKPKPAKTKAGDITEDSAENCLDLLSFVINNSQAREEIFKHFRHVVRPRVLK